MSERYYKVEGNIIYPDKQMLTWGPFYYHFRNNGVEKMESILDNITAWCNTKDTSLNIKPENVIRTNDNTQIVFDIKAWKDNNTLQVCKGIITIENIFFED